MDVGMGGVERDLVSDFWISFQCDILALLRQVLRLGSDSSNVLAYTVLVSNLGKCIGISLDAMLGFTLGCTAVFLSMMNASNILDMFRIFLCMISDRRWIGEGVFGFFIILNRSWDAPISIYVADVCGIGIFYGQPL